MEFEGQERRLVKHGKAKKVLKKPFPSYLYTTCTMNAGGKRRGLNSINTSTFISQDEQQSYAIINF